MDEKAQQAGKTSAGGPSGSDEGHSKNAAEIDEGDAHPVYQQIIDRAYEVKVEIDCSVDVSDRSYMNCVGDRFGDKIVTNTTSTIKSRLNQYKPKKMTKHMPITKKMAKKKWDLILQGTFST